MALMPHIDRYSADSKKKKKKEKKSKAKKKRIKITDDKCSDD